jgi:cytochrome c
MIRNGNLRYGVIVGLVIGVVALGSAPAGAQDAVGTYKAKCAACHGPDGSGSATGKKLGAHDFQTGDV